jgi:hypothetical protein
MRNSLLMLCALGLLVAVPTAVSAGEGLNVAHRWALGLQANAVNAGLNPTVEYWTSENFGISANVRAYFYWVGIGVRGTYLWDTPIHIFPIPARPYAGAGLGFDNYWLGVTGESFEVFGGLLQPLNDRWSVRAELNAGWSIVRWGDHVRPGWYSPVSIGLGIFYHFPGK